MATISAQQFLKGGTETQLVAPADSNYGLPQEQEQSYLSRVGSSIIEAGKEAFGSIEKRSGQIEKGMERQVKGEQNVVQTAGNIVGATAGTINDVIGSLFKVGISALPNIIKTPVKQTITKLADAMVNNDTIYQGLNALNQGIDQYKLWGKKNPGYDQNIKDLVNTALLYPGSMGAKGATNVVKRSIAPITEAIGKIPPAGPFIAGTELKIGQSFIKAGEKIQSTVIRPMAIDIKNGFKIENVTKHNLAGPLEKSLPKTTNKLKELSASLKQNIEQLSEKPVLNLGEAIEKVRDQFVGKGLKMLGQKSSIDTTISQIEKELDDILPNWRDEVVNFTDAIDAKRAAGLNASFLHGQLKTGLSADEKVWNSLYKILQEETKRVAAGTPFAEINKKISEIIPIEQAMIRRIPVAERNNVISLPDMIVFGLSSIEPKALTLGVLNRMLKSGTVAETLINTGKKMSRQEVKKLVQNATKYDNEFKKTVDQVANSGKWKVEHGPVKKAERLMKKITDEGETVETLRDANRSTIIVDNPNELSNVIASVKKQFGNTSRIKDKFNYPLGEYRSAIINVKTPLGHEAEIAVATPEYWRAKTIGGGDEMYDKVRSKIEGWEKIKIKMNKLYTDADKAVLDRLKSSSDI